MLFFKVSKSFVVLAMSISVMCFCSTTALADGEDEEFSNQAIIELVDPETTDINDVIVDYPDLVAVIGQIPNLGIYLIQLSGVMSEDEFDALGIEENDSRVDDAEINDEPDTNDGNTQDFFFAALQQQYSDHYSWPLIGTSQAQQRSTGNGILVAILDTGVNSTHSALAGHVVEGFNFILNNNETDETAGNGIDDDGDIVVDEMFGHGTFMAGIVAKIAPESMILPVTVLNDDGAGDSFVIAQGIYYAIEQGADVINLSMGTRSENDIVEDAVNFAQQNGVVVVAAAGNSNVNVPIQYPAAFSTVVGVAGTDARDIKSIFSNFGTYVDLSAPASEMVSAYPGNGFAQGNGTSMATAVVSASAALVLADHPSWLRNEERAVRAIGILTSSATNIDSNNNGYQGQLGAGRINIDAAMEQSRVAANLTNLELAIGRVLDGGIVQIEASNDTYLHTRSGFGSTFAELHTTRLNVTASSEINNPAVLRVVVEGYIDQAAGSAKIRVFNWQSSNYEPVASYSIGLNEEMFVIDGLDATRYIDETGMVKVQIRHVVFVPFIAYAFESYIDHVSIEID